uniref:Uncharacterized protein n=1 Tax=Lepeophtheirus salmonis TaxID=72036 RepID=A0A0K2VFU2_LEPSM
MRKNLKKRDLSPLSSISYKIYLHSDMETSNIHFQSNDGCQEIK